jgi:hypothetical protein
VQSGSPGWHCRDWRAATKFSRGRQSRAAGKANPDSEPFLAHLLSLAADDQAIAACTGGWAILPEQRDHSSAQDIWNSLVADDPDYFQIVHSVGRVGMHLQKLLDGNATLAAICPQESSLTTLLRQVLGAAGKQKLGHAVRDLIARGLRDLPAGRRLAIVEISEGQPSFAMDACVAMDFNRGDYLFASTSAATLEEVGQQTQGGIPGHHHAAARQPAASDRQDLRLCHGHRHTRFRNGRQRHPGPAVCTPQPRSGRLAAGRRSAPLALDRLRFWCPACRLAAYRRRTLDLQSTSEWFLATTGSKILVWCAPNPSSFHPTPFPALTSCTPTARTMMARQALASQGDPAELDPVGRPGRLLGAAFRPSDEQAAGARRPGHPGRTGQCRADRIPAR